MKSQDVEARYLPERAIGNDPEMTIVGGSLEADGSQMHFSAPFIDRPVATMLLSIALILAGIAGYSVLPVSSLPQVEFAVINVSASLPGADPETMASAVATPLERQFGRIAGINEMTSTSSAGSTSISMQFDLGRNINGAARDVQAAINAAKSQLPTNMPQNPTAASIHTRSCVHMNKTGTDRNASST